MSFLWTWCSFFSTVLLSSFSMSFFHFYISSLSISCTFFSQSLDYIFVYEWWNSPGQNTGVGSLSLLQGIFPTQVLNPGLPHYMQILYQLSQKGSPRILEWVAYPFFQWIFLTQESNRVFCFAGGFFSNWAIGEAPTIITARLKPQRKGLLNAVVLCFIGNF